MCLHIPSRSPSRAQVKRARTEARRLGRIAETRAVRLGELGEAFERAGFVIFDAMRLYSEYMERRHGLEQVTPPLPSPSS